MLRFLFVIFFISFSQIAFAAKQNPVFNINNIAINQNFENVSNAREQALKLATEIAFKKLLKKLTDAPYETFKESSITPSLFVVTYDIKKEKISSKHYEAIFSFQFNQEMIREFFKKHHIAYSEIQSQPILIIPLVKKDYMSVLWEEKTDWFRAWQNYSNDEHKLSIIVPSGDIQDLSLLSVNDIRDHNMQAFRKIMQRYQTAFILISEIQPLSDTQFIVRNRLFNNRKKINGFNLNVKKGATLDETYNDIQAYITNTLWQFKKSRNVISNHQEKTLKTEISIHTLENLVDLEKKLQAINTVKSFTIDKILANRVSLTIYYIGSEDTLREQIFNF